VKLGGCEDQFAKLAGVKNYSARDAGREEPTAAISLDERQTEREM
jgi:hypothetical protein